jgi:uncharacterized repeat protein (TIGR04138 family)
MDKPNFSETLERILKADPRYAREAYIFVREGLDFTLKSLRKKGETGHRHVSGQELLEGLRRYSLEQFGPMSKTVLNYWGIAACEDFAEIVFNMVDQGVLGKTDDDRREDFQNGYDFDEAFVIPYLPPSRLRASRGTKPEPETPEYHRRNRSPAAKPKKLSGGTG